MPYGPTQSRPSSLDRPAKSSSGLWALLIIMLILLIGVIVVIVIYLLIYKPGAKCSGVMLDSNTSGRVAGSSHERPNMTERQSTSSAQPRHAMVRTQSTKPSGAVGNKWINKTMYTRTNSKSPQAQKTDHSVKTHTAGTSCSSSNSSQKVLQHLQPGLGSAQMDVTGNQLVSLGGSGLKNHLNAVSDSHGVKVQGLKGISKEENLKVMKSEKLQAPKSWKHDSDQLLEQRDEHMKLSIKARQDPRNASQYTEQMGASTPVTRLGMQAAQTAATQLRGTFERPNLKAVSLDSYYRPSLTLPTLSATSVPWGSTYEAAAASASQACTVASNSPISPQSM